MKKLVLMLAAASMAASVSAQTVAESKAFDNVYVGINGGVATKTTGHKWLSDLDPNAGLRIGRYFTPVFGLAVEGNAYFSNKPWGSTGTVVRATNVHSRLAHSMVLVGCTCSQMIRHLRLIQRISVIV